jgi:hypothetical protein
VSENTQVKSRKPTETDLSLVHPHSKRSANLIIDNPGLSMATAKPAERAFLGLPSLLIGLA